MSGWRKCDTCRKVRPLDEFDGGSPTCLNCLTARTSARRSPAPVTRSTAPASREPRKPAPATARPSAQRSPLLGAIGSGDLEVRERRARRAAQEALVASHPEEFALLLRDAREKEGLRPLSSAGDGAGRPGPTSEFPAGSGGVGMADATSPEGLPEA